MPEDQDAFCQMDSINESKYVHKLRIFPIIRSLCYGFLLGFLIFVVFITSELCTSKRSEQMNYSCFCCV